MKVHSPLIILALWLTALVIASCLLYSCDKADVRPGDGDCSGHNKDTTVTVSDTTSQI